MLIFMIETLLQSMVGGTEEPANDVRALLNAEVQLARDLNNITVCRNSLGARSPF